MKKISIKNLFSVEGKLPKADEEEVFEKIIEQEDFLLERIISTGQQSPEGFWYEQQRDEWVVLLQGKATLQFQRPNEEVQLKAGDSILLPALCKHRVSHTSNEPPCIWLALHYKVTK